MGRACPEPRVPFLIARQRGQLARVHFLKRLHLPGDLLRLNLEAQLLDLLLLALPHLQRRALLKMRRRLPGILPPMQRPLDQRHAGDPTQKRGKTGRPIGLPLVPDLPHADHMIGAKLCSLLAMLRLHCGAQSVVLVFQGFALVLDGFAPVALRMLERCKFCGTLIGARGLLDQLPVRGDKRLRLIH